MKPLTTDPRRWLVFVLGPLAALVCNAGIVWSIRRLLEGPYLSLGALLGGFWLAWIASMCVIGLVGMACGRYESPLVLIAGFAPVYVGYIPERLTIVTSVVVVALIYCALTTPWLKAHERSRSADGKE